MGKNLIKFLTDFGPLLIFFLIYYSSEQKLEAAIPPFIIATLIALAVVYLLEKKIPMVPLFGGMVQTGKSTLKQAEPTN